MPISKAGNDTKHVELRLAELTPMMVKEMLYADEKQDLSYGAGVWAVIE
jgi:hypothetical protein